MKKALISSAFFADRLSAAKNQFSDGLRGR
jgi:hypothetical protein